MFRFTYFNRTSFQTPRYTSEYSSHIRPNTHPMPTGKSSKYLCMLVYGINRLENEIKCLTVRSCYNFRFFVNVRNYRNLIANTAQFGFRVLSRGNSDSRNDLHTRLWYRSFRNCVTRSWNV